MSDYERIGRTENRTGVRVGAQRHYMNKQEFFKKLYSGYTTREDQIIAILQARGFLIHHDDHGYYLSDNAAIQDVQYLTDGMKKYSLGTVSGCSFKNNFRGIKVIADRTARIHVDPVASIDDAIAFFEEAGQVAYEVCFQECEWYSFVFHDYGVKVPVKNLEPYVSFYVKAVSACGVLTDFSCDGNHWHGGRVIVGAAYPYNLWHEQIWKNCIPLPWKISEGVHFSDKTQYDVYYKLNKIARWLYENRFYLGNVKRKACKAIPKTDIRHHNIEESERIFLNSCDFSSIKKVQFAEHPGH